MKTGRSVIKTIASFVRARVYWSKTRGQLAELSFLTARNAFTITVSKPGIKHRHLNGYKYNSMIFQQRIGIYNIVVRCVHVDGPEQTNVCIVYTWIKWREQKVYSENINVKIEQKQKHYTFWRNSNLRLYYYTFCTLSFIQRTYCTKKIKQWTKLFISYLNQYNNR